MLDKTIDMKNLRSENIFGKAQTIAERNIFRVLLLHVKVV